MFKAAVPTPGIFFEKLVPSLGSHRKFGREHKSARARTIQVLEVKPSRQHPTRTDLLLPGQDTCQCSGIWLYEPIGSPVADCALIHSTRTCENLSCTCGALKPFSSDPNPHDVVIPDDCVSFIAPLSNSRPCVHPLSIRYRG